MSKETSTVLNDFEGQERIEPKSEDGLVIDVGGYEGPIDALLNLARDQKVDLNEISILELADQYLNWIGKIRGSNLELAADYLVMAAWRAYLKSRLLEPDINSDEEPTGEQMAEALQFQLRRLESMQEAGTSILSRLRLGLDFFQRGNPEKFGYNSTSIYEVSLFDLLKAYGEHTHRSNIKTLHIESSQLFSIDDLVRSMLGKKGGIPDWRQLDDFFPIEARADILGRSAIAATFAAALQLAKDGKILLRQGSTFDPIYLKDNDQ